MIPLEEFSAAANASGAVLPHFHFPPYLLPRRDMPALTPTLNP